MKYVFHWSFERSNSIMKNNIISKILRISFQFLLEKKKKKERESLTFVVYCWTEIVIW